DNADTFVVGADAQGSLSVQVSGSPMPTITAKNIQELHIDSHRGTDAITVNDLAATTVRTVAINGNEAGQPLDGSVDIINLSGKPVAASLKVSEVEATSQAEDNKPPVTGKVMDVNGFAAEFLVANDGDSLNLNPADGDAT